MTAPLEWDREKASRAHIVANIVAAASLLAIAGMGAVYVLCGAP